MFPIPLMSFSHTNSIICDNGSKTRNFKVGCFRYSTLLKNIFATPPLDAH